MKLYERRLKYFWGYKWVYVWKHPLGLTQRFQKDILSWPWRRCVSMDFVRARREEVGNASGSDS